MSLGFSWHSDAFGMSQQRRACLFCHLFCLEACVWVPIWEGTYWLRLSYPEVLITRNRQVREPIVNCHIPAWGDGGCKKQVWFRGEWDVQTCWGQAGLCTACVSMLPTSPAQLPPRGLHMRSLTYSCLLSSSISSLILQQIKTLHLSLAPASLLDSDSQLAPKYYYSAVLMSHQIHYSIASSSRATPSFPTQNLGNHPTIFLPFQFASARLVCYKDPDTFFLALPLSTSHPCLAVNYCKTSAVSSDSSNPLSPV